ncbi:MAG: SoxY-related AACIE arm protein [Alphaproteobacteria bacterium]|nr:SoxY-related AACIE arm protein [Alphaproteobacteria bacterium]
MQRRSFLAGTTALVAVLPLASAHATPESLQAAIREVVGSAALREGKVKIDLPALVENGNTVPLGVTVDSPMTATDRVKAIHVFNEKNPQPHVYTATLGPGLARADISTRIKLGDSQKIVVVAETSKGEFWTASADVIVTLAACLEDLT